MVTTFKPSKLFKANYIVVSLVAIASLLTTSIVVYRQNGQAQAAWSNPYSIGGNTLRMCKQSVDIGYGPMYQLTAVGATNQSFILEAFRPIPKNGNPYGGGWQWTNGKTSTPIAWPGGTYAQTYLSSWQNDWYQIRVGNSYASGMLSPAFTPDC